MSWQQKPNLSVWGAGLMADGQSMLIKPKKIYAVRGPLTRNLLLNQGIECPEIYGDPALLFPRFYDPIIEKKYKLGIIPHYVDKDCNWIKSIQDENIKILNICSETHEFVRELKECEKVVSSSLHGLIAADAYRIPNMWLSISNKIGGAGFKFYDYFASVKREPKCFVIKDNTPIEDVYKEIPEWKIDIDLDLLYGVCPFKK